jgi:hypothetical protein
MCRERNACFLYRRLHHRKRSWASGRTKKTRFGQLRFLVQSYRTAKTFLNDLVPILKLKLRAIEIQDEKANG